MPCCTTAHIPSRKSLMIFMSCRRAHRAGVTAPAYSSTSRRSAASSSPAFTARLPRSNHASFMPAYSQSRSHARSRSNSTLAGSRSLWHGTSGVGAAASARSTSWARSCSAANRAGVATPWARASRSCHSTTRKIGKRPAMGPLAWKRRSRATTAGRRSAKATGSSMWPPCTKRVTSVPTPGSSPSTGGPMPSASARAAASASHARSMPSTSVRSPGRRSIQAVPSGSVTL